MPYFSEEDIPEPFCSGSYTEAGWEGQWDDPSRPQKLFAQFAK
jgi:hypothetical protein